MKHLNSFFLALMLTMPIMASATQSSDSSKPRPPITLQKGNGNVHVKCPQAPDRQLVTCAYDGEGIALSFVIPEGIATLIVSEEYLQYATYTVDTSYLMAYVPVGTLTGVINVQLYTERGNLYYGIILDTD